MAPEKIEESATRSDMHVPAPTPGQLEKARAFVRAWPPADRAHPDFTLDRVSRDDMASALAALLAEEVHETAQAAVAVVAAADGCAAEVVSLREVLRVAGGALSDLAQLAGRPDVRAVLDAYRRPSLVSVLGKMPAGVYRVTPEGVERVADVAGVSFGELQMMLDAKGNGLHARVLRMLGNARSDAGLAALLAPPILDYFAAGVGVIDGRLLDRVYTAVLAVRVPGPVRVSVGERIQELARERDAAVSERDAARAECERLSSDLAAFLRSVDAAIHGAKS